MDKSSFLNYYKTILEKVSFDNRLLEKEYKKAKELLEGPEAKDLDYWVKRQGLLRKMEANPIDKNNSRMS
ncbi:hypothetical protein LV84_02485 [Algoriphagus ratkowskyi]|uniref:Uncharacterized protein n=1 Tax=Algoriphagus ratkowskyi TaxID=57028 RepID=A0A2W7RIF5_9BACT|nr:hypothetical protein [Algoriphagus ratkowskyi]PZX55347.1 hypothetical protein LV84_02485 [Algoriphagus ratkowskyi]TXD79722.1 hypothetical protein ESW18_00905 [Algoriphagus ratkowskyi]